MKSKIGTFQIAIHATSCLKWISLGFLKYGWSRRRWKLQESRHWRAKGRLFEGKYLNSKRTPGDVIKDQGHQG